MASPSIELDLSTDLTTENDVKQLSIKVSQKDGNAIEIRDDGLYASGGDGGGGPGYTGTYTEEGIRLGYANPFDNEKVDKRVLCTNIIHHVFTGSIINNTKLAVDSFFRPDIDCALPGDIVRVPVEGQENVYSYYLVIDTSNPGIETTGNYITGYIKLWEGDINA